MTETKVIETHIVATAQPQSEVTDTAQTVKPRNRHDIREVITAWADEDQLPFDPLVYNYRIFSRRPVVQIERFRVPVLNSLTSSEDWYFKKVEAVKMESLIGARGDFGHLNQLAKTQLGLKDDQTIWDVITGGKGGLLNFTDGREGEFIQAHRDEITRFMRSWMAMSNDINTQIARIYFFLRRCGDKVLEEWWEDMTEEELAQTKLVDLTPELVSEIFPVYREQLLALITKEANNGKDPDNEPPEDAPRDDGGGGKALASPNEAPSGETSIGNSTVVHTSETNGLVPDVLELNLVG